MTRFGIAVLLVGGIVLTGCASNTVTTMAIGVGHSEWGEEIGNTTNGWRLGGSVGFTFSGGGLSAIHTCGGGSIGNTEEIHEDDKSVQNDGRAAICTEFLTSPDADHHQNPIRFW